MFRLTNDEKSFLLRLARRSLEAAVCGSRAEAPAGVPAALEDPGSAFVTLHQQALLRGCVGFLGFRNPLYQAVMEAAASAALHDTRFRPVTPREISTLEVEISVLSRFWQATPEQIEVGVHGLMVSRGAARGLLLPQVAVERNWTVLRFLEETCRKAGLPPQAWREDAKIEAFTAEVFGERSFGGSGPSG
jgi:AmmeMemoRadiSam system protein A